MIYSKCDFKFNLSERLLSKYKEFSKGICGKNKGWEITKDIDYKENNSIVLVGDFFDGVTDSCGGFSFLGQLHGVSLIRNQDSLPFDWRGFDAPNNKQDPIPGRKGFNLFLLGTEWKNQCGYCVYPFMRFCELKKRWDIHFHPKKDGFNPKYDRFLVKQCV